MSTAPVDHLALRSPELRFKKLLAHSMQSAKRTLRARYGGCLFGRRSVANTYANGERRAPWWTPS
jgi:hypothetical protein